MNIQIDKEKCTNCGLCSDICQNYVYHSEAKNGDKNFIAKYPEECCGCGQCVAICPQGAITHESYNLNAFKEIPSVNISYDDMMNWMLARRSTRHYKDKQIPKEEIEKLMSAAVHAGTSSNGQTEDFIIIQDRNLLEKMELDVIDELWNAGLKHLGSEGFVGNIVNKVLLKKYGEELIGQYFNYYHIIKNRRANNEEKGMVFRNAPTLIVMHGLKSNVLAHANCSIAMRNIELLAPTLGLGTCWAGFFIVVAMDKNPEKMREYLGLGEDREIYGALMIGYPTHKFKKGIPRPNRNVKWL